MPGPSRTKAEAKYNVTTDFPQLGLHFAAATGNVGLVAYALSHGQPINSVLDGVLPLHAACSGGNDLVVRLLIENGADVNAPRLPRRYSNDKHRDASAPIVGNSGSTPLHFAAANGHTAVVTTLLLHGAHAHRPDKHGITPEILARQNGQFECADLLHEWELNKDRDLREREAVLGEQPVRGASSASDTPETFPRKRIHVIDNAFNLFRSDPHARASSSTSPPASIRAHDQPLHSARPLGEYTYYPVDSDRPPEVSERRPSLPHVDIVPKSPPPTSRPPPSPRRPRSAGTDAESPPSQPTHPRKLGTKYSLLHLFRKAHPTSEVSITNADPSQPHSITPPAPALPSACPIPIQSASSDSQVLDQSPKAVPLSSSLGSYKTRYVADDGDSPKLFPIASEMHRTMQRQHHSHIRSTSGNSTPGGVYGTEFGATAGSSNSRQTHLRSSPHGFKTTLRYDSTSSRSGNAPFCHNSVWAWSPATRALKSFRSAGSLSRSTSASEAYRFSAERVPESAPAEGFDFQDVPSGVGCEEEDEEEYGVPVGRSHFLPASQDVGLPRSIAPKDEEHRSAGSSTSSFEQALEPDASVQIDTHASSPSVRAFDLPFSIHRPPPLDIDPQSKSVTTRSHPNVVPCSPSPPPVPASASDASSLVPGPDNRARGDSVSSVSTDGSHNPQLSSSGTTATSGSSVTTPGIAPMGSVYSTTQDQHGRDAASFILAGSQGLLEAMADQAAEELTSLGHVDRDAKDGGDIKITVNDRFLSVGERRSHSPLDIDIRSISSHAQAEALVQLRQRSILETTGYPTPLHDAVESKQFSAGPITAGRTPLSAKLAAYGESLALERKLKEEEAKKGSMPSAIPSGDVDPDTPLASGRVEGVERAGVLEHGSGKSSKSRRVGLNRQFSLEQKPSADLHSRVRVPKRPNTSGGMSADARPFPSSSSPGNPSDPILGPQSAGLATGSRISSPLKQTTALPSDRCEYLSDEFPQPVVRSHTPERDMLREVKDLGESGEEGGVLYRVSTAQSDSACDDTWDDQARQVASANKLTRMGFAAGDGRHGVATRPASPRNFSGSRRFGGFKTLMQTLKGRS